MAPVYVYGAALYVIRLCSACRSPVPSRGAVRWPSARQNVPMGPPRNLSSTASAPVVGLCVLSSLKASTCPQDEDTRRIGTCGRMHARCTWRRACEWHTPSRRHPHTALPHSQWSGATVTRTTAIRSDREAARVPRPDMRGPPRTPSLLPHTGCRDSCTQSPRQHDTQGVMRGAVAFAGLSVAAAPQVLWGCVRTATWGHKQHTQKNYVAAWYCAASL